MIFSNLMIPHRRKLCLWLLLTPLLAPAAFAAVDEASLTNSIVSLQIYKGGSAVQDGSGFVVQGDRFNGYIVTNARLIRDAESLTVSVPGRGGQLVAQVLESDLSADYALLKVNGLDLPALKFSRNEPSAGDVVWTAAKLRSRDKADGSKISVSKGLLRTGFKLIDSDTGWYQHTAQLPGTGGAVLLNDCGQVLGLNFTQTAGDGSVRALDLSTLTRFLGKQNVKLQRASEVCVSDVIRATEKAETASVEAQLAQQEARRAQTVAKQLEKQLSASQKTNTNL
ncbi:MAG: S1-C subfamily serine protease, partial [Candidatus Azotimanducaceae bacterium]